MMRKPKSVRCDRKTNRRSRSRSLAIEQFEKRVVFTMAPLYDPIDVKEAVGGSIANDGTVVTLAVDSTEFPALAPRKVFIDRGDGENLNLTPKVGKLANNAVKLVGDLAYGWIEQSPGDDRLSKWDRSGIPTAIEFSVPGALSLDIHPEFSGYDRQIPVDPSGVATVLATARFTGGSYREVIVQSDGDYGYLPAGQKLINLIDSSDDGRVLVGVITSSSSGSFYSELLVYDSSLSRPQVIVSGSGDYERIKAAAIGADGNTVAFVASGSPPDVLSSIYAVSVGEPSLPTRLIGSARDQVRDLTETSISIPSLPKSIHMPFGKYDGSHVDIMPSIQVSALQDTSNGHEFFVGYETLHNSGRNVFRMSIGQVEDDDGKISYLSGAPDPVFIAEHTTLRGKKEGTEIEIEGKQLRVLDARLLDMNASGEIVALVQSTNHGQSSATTSTLIKTEFARRPLLVVPGIVGSFPGDWNFKDWIFNLGYDPEDLYLDPIANTYAPLVDALESSGYEKDKDLFEAAYDWRLAPAPRDGVYDGHITFPEIESYLSNIENRHLRYGVDYLVYWIRKAQTTWEEAHPGHQLDTVDVIAHSTGGLLTRAYAQSSIYDQPTTAAGDAKLPKIGSFVMAAVPNLGAPKALSFLNDNWWIDSDEVIYPYLLRGIANTAFQAVLDDGRIMLDGKTFINLETLLPGQNTDEFVAWYRTASPSDPFASAFRRKFIDTYVAQIRGLVAYDAFIEVNGGLVSPQSLGPSFVNYDLLDLNSGADRSFVSDGEKSFYDFLSVFHGSGSDTTIRQIARVGAVGGIANELMHLDQTHRIPEPGENYFEPVLANTRSDGGSQNVLLTGDGTVPRSSLVARFENLPLVNHREFVTIGLAQLAGENAVATEGNVDHISLLSEPRVVSNILAQLGHAIQPSDVEPNGILESVSKYLRGGGTLALMLFDPIRASIIDPLGRRLGMDSSGSKRIEIPEGRYYGYEDGIGIAGIEDAGTWTVEINGIGGEYQVDVLTVRGSETATLNVSGTLAFGEQLVFEMPFIGADHSPRAGNDSVKTKLGSRVRIPFLVNDYTFNNQPRVSITSMPLSGQVQVDSATGNLIYTSEAIGLYSVQYVISDSLGRQSLPATISIEVNPNDQENHAPMDITVSQRSIPELRNGASIGTITAVDPDVYDRHRFVISDSRFVVVGNKLKLRDDVTLDSIFESAVTLHIDAIDDGTPSLSVSKTFTFEIERNTTPWFNALLREDVNQDGTVSPIDALLVINELNRDRSNPLKRPETAPRYLIDVSKDNNLSPIDALLVINALNRRSSGEGEALPAIDEVFEDFASDFILGFVEDIVEARKKLRGHVTGK